MSDQYISLDEALAPVEPKSAGKAKNPQYITLDEALAPVDASKKSEPVPQPSPSSEGKILDNNNVDDPWYKWVPKRAITIGSKALSHVPGFAGDLGDAVDLGMAAAEAGGRSALSRIAPVDNLSTMEIMERNRKNAALSRGPIPQPPSGQDIYNSTVKPVAGEYMSSTAGGRAVDAALEAALTPMPVGGKGKFLRTMGEYAFPNAVAGGAGQLVTEKTGNPVLGALAGAGAAIPAAGIARTVGNYGKNVSTEAARDRSARGLAGQVYREAAINPDEAKARLTNPDLDPGLPGYASTTARRAQDDGISGLESRLERIGRNIEDSGGPTVNQTMGQRNIANTEALNNAVDDVRENIRQSGQSGAAGQLGVTGRTEGDASMRASSLREAAEMASKSNVNTLWDNFDQAGGKLYANKVVGQLEELRTGLKPSDRALVDKDLQLAVEDLQHAQTGKTTGVRALQDARSTLLKKARDAGAQQNFTLRDKLNEVAARMADIMTDKSNYLFGDKKDATGAWQNAVDATRDHHQTWDTQSLSRQRAVDKAGELKVDPHEMLRDTFAGRNAAQKTQQLINAVGNDPALMRQAQDWHVSDLTDGGVRVPKPAQIDKYLADHAQVIDQIPGLRGRLEHYRNLSHTDMVMENFNVAATDPNKLIRFMERNRKDITEVGNRTGQTDLFNKLELAARELNTKMTGQPASAATLEHLTHGRMISLMYGTMTERLGTGLAGIIGLKLAGSSLGHGAETTLSMVGGAAGAGGHRGFHNFLNSTLGKAMTRDIQERTIRILQESRNNPQLAKELMETASPERLQKLYKSIPSLAAVRETLDAQDEQGNEIVVRKPPRE